MEDQAERAAKQAALHALATDVATAVLTLVGDLVAGRKHIIIEGVPHVRSGRDVSDKRVAIR